MTEINSLEESVKDGKALVKLMENADFKRLFIKKQENKLLEIGYSAYHLDNARKEKAHKEQEHIGYFFGKMYEIIEAGKSAQEQLNDLAEMENEDA